jgi:TM2 domain-containing protein/RING finger family protein
VSAACPYCRTAVDDADNRQDCIGCGTPHHADCYAENGGCTVFGCSQAPADEPKVTVTAPEAVAQLPTSSAPEPAAVPIVELEPSGWRPPSVLGLSAPLPSANASNSSVTEVPAPPSPTHDTTAVPPPPLPPGVVPSPMPVSYASTRPPSLAEVYSGFHAPRNRVTYILLGVFLGALGVHNFYAGYVRKAAAQLCISLFTCFYASFVSWIWAIVEVCTITEDSEGVQFS